MANTPLMQEVMEHIHNWFEKDMLIGELTSWTASSPSRMAS